MAYKVKKNHLAEFNIDYGVGSGPGAANHPDDVMLVQMLFRVLHIKFGGAVSDYGSGTVVKPPAQYPMPSAPDGKIGPVTNAYIRNWQAFLAKRSMALSDGVFTPVRYDANGSAQNFVTPSGAFYRSSLYMLNATLQRPVHNPQMLFDELANDHHPESPVTLKKALKTPRLYAHKYG